MRIVHNEAPIRDLLSHFSPTSTREPTVYEFGPTAEDLKAYRLNPNQATAFVHLIKYGPVGLLQGPPGTGKTEFIAAFVHWLTTKGGAGKVLIASQSHEAVNAALEKLIERFRQDKRSPELLRIGTKGITPEILPFHSDTLRHRYARQFESAFKTKIAIAAKAVGLSRAFSHDAVDLDRKLGSLLHRIEVLEGFLRSDTISDADQDELERKVRMVGGLFNHLASEHIEFDDATSRADVYARLCAELREKHSATPADLGKLSQLLQLAREWLDGLYSGRRNFDEFLARTRRIIAGTCVGVGRTQLRIDSTSFDWVIVDEAARCAPGELAVAAQLGRRILLVGDHLQLPPMIERDLLADLKAFFPNVPDELLGQSDFERAIRSDYGKACSSILRTQYRMVDPICRLVSDVFYKPENIVLETADEREVDLRFSGPVPAAIPRPITWLDTARMPKHLEQIRDKKKSRRNEAEARVICTLLERIAAETEFSAQLVNQKGQSVGVICMYSWQKEMLEEEMANRPFSMEFRKSIKIDTVDSYQGKDNTIVIVSLVSANKVGDPGHVGRNHRMNVAVSRAKERLVIVGSQAFWCQFNDTIAPARVLRWIASGKKEDALIVDARIL